MENEIINVEKFIQERIEENKNLFTNNEIKTIEQNKIITKKIYLLGFVNSKDCFN